MTKKKVSTIGTLFELLYLMALSMPMLIIGVIALVFTGMLIWELIF